MPRGLKSPEPEHPGDSGWVLAGLSRAQLLPTCVTSGKALNVRSLGFLVSTWQLTTAPTLCGVLTAE